MMTTTKFSTLHAFMHAARISHMIRPVATDHQQNKQRIKRA
jgi:hypothetical protein